MTNGNRKKTAADLVAELNSADVRAPTSPMLPEDAKSELRSISQTLRSIGIDSELPAVHLTTANRRMVIDVLLCLLPTLRSREARMQIVRFLSVPKAQRIAGVGMIQEYKRALAERADSLAWAAANALAVVADETLFADLEALVLDRTGGSSREMLAVALGRIQTDCCKRLVLRLLDDEEIAGHALIAVGKLKLLEARSRVERFLRHPKSWIRNEAKATLRKLDRS